MPFLLTTCTIAASQGSDPVPSSEGTLTSEDDSLHVKEFAEQNLTSFEIP